MLGRKMKGRGRQELGKVGVCALYCCNRSPTEEEESQDRPCYDGISCVMSRHEQAVTLAAGLRWRSTESDDRRLRAGVLPEIPRLANIPSFERVEWGLICVLGPTTGWTVEGLSKQLKDNSPVHAWRGEKKVRKGQGGGPKRGHTGRRGPSSCSVTCSPSRRRRVRTMGPRSNATPAGRGRLSHSASEEQKGEHWVGKLTAGLDSRPGLKEKPTTQDAFR